MKIAKLLRDFFFVKKCVCCGEILIGAEADEAFCGRCLSLWMQELVVSCPNCMQSMVECTCMPRALSDSGALTLRKLTRYDKSLPAKPQNKLVLFLKNRKNKRASVFVAKELMPQLNFELSVLDIKAPEAEAFITYVPRSRRAVSGVGHDQSKLICHALSEISGIPCYPIIRRKRGGKEQKKLTPSERVKNARKLFEADPKLAESVDGRYAILFDDIVTTGASLSAAVRVLKNAGVANVICLSVAITPKK